MHKLAFPHFNPNGLDLSQDYLIFLILHVHPCDRDVRPAQSTLDLYFASWSFYEDA